jgi:hypothetical protein
MGVLPSTLEEAMRVGTKFWSLYASAILV